MKKVNLANSVAAGVVAAGLSLSTALVFVPPALAQSILNAEQLSAIASSLKAALKSAASQSAAIEAAISSAEKGAIALYGTGNTSSITSAIIDTAETESVDQCTIGRGLGDAAGSLATSNLAGAQAIAGALANEGRSMERSCFKTALESKGLTQLAALADGDAAVTGGTGPTGGTGGQGGIGLGGIGGGATGGGNAGGGGGGCLNPSCTSL